MVQCAKCHYEIAVCDPKVYMVFSLSDGNQGAIGNLWTILVKVFLTDDAIELIGSIN